MTDKEFVLSLYPNARLLVYNSNYIINIHPESGECVGWNRHNPKKTWHYARKDIEYRMMAKLNQ